MASVFHNMTAMAWLTGMMISPEALALQGNLAGISGNVFIVPLALALILHGLNIASSPWPDEIELLQRAYGSMGASFLLLVARPAVAVCLSTAAVVTAGFAFNEIFVNWFPNFGFAALLLIIITMANLAGQRLAEKLQFFLAITALSGLFMLVLAGFGGSGPETPNASYIIEGIGFESLGLGVIAFIGYDLIRYTDVDNDARHAKNLTLIAIAAMGLLFWSWNATALAHVAPSRLADTSIPHVLAAKAVLGPAGRIIIGIVVITGACAAVNLAFRAVSQMMVVMAKRGLMPATSGMSPARPWLPLLIMGGLTGLLMAVGFAGSDWLDISLRGGLILWTMAIGLSHLAPLMPGFARHAPYHGAKHPMISRFGHLILGVIMTTLAIILTITHDEPVLLFQAMLTLTTLAAALTAASLMAARWPIHRRRKASPRKEGVPS